MANIIIYGLLGLAVVGIYACVQWVKKIPCPNCNNRILVRQEGRELIKEHAGQKLKTFTKTSLATSGNFQFAERTLPVAVKRREYVYRYRCDHCAYSWRIRKNSEDEDI